MDTHKIYCEKNGCSITVNGCLKRQERASINGLPKGGWHKIPLDLFCKNCEQGKTLKQKNTENTNINDHTNETVQNDIGSEDKKIDKPQQEIVNKKIEIPNGYCQCGCGGKTKVIEVNDSSKGYIKGEHYKYIRGHNVGSLLTKKENRQIKYEYHGYTEKLKQLPDWRELEFELARRASENLREVEAQAVWELAEALRK